MNDQMQDDDTPPAPARSLSNYGSRAVRYTADTEADIGRAYRKRYARRRGWNHPIVTVLLGLFVVGVMVVWVAWVL